MFSGIYKVEPFALMMFGEKMSILVTELTPVMLQRVRANRADSGSPLWKPFYFLSVPEAKQFMSQNECCGDVKPVHAFHEIETDKYYLAKE